MRVFRHFLELAFCQHLQFSFRLGLVTLQFLMLQMIPHIFIRIPVGRIGWQIEHMSAPSKADMSQLDNPARSKANHQIGTELCV